MSFVTIVGYDKKRNQSGGSFIVLNLEGSLQFNKSEETGSTFASTRKTNIIANMDEKACKALIGTQVPGEIKRVETDPYTYTKPSGESIVLEYKYEFYPALDAEEDYSA